VRGDALPVIALLVIALPVIALRVIAQPVIDQGDRELTESEVFQRVGHRSLEGRRLEAECRLCGLAISPIVEYLVARADIDIAKTSLKTARIAHSRTARSFPGKDDRRLRDCFDDVVGVSL